MCGYLCTPSPRIHRKLGLNWAMHVDVLERHVHCIDCFGIVMSWGWLCQLVAFTRYNILYVCSIGVCGLFGVQLCYVRLCKGLLCVGECMWRVIVAMCRFHSLGRMYSWGWDVLVARRCCPSGFPCIGRIEI